MDVERIKIPGLYDSGIYSQAVRVGNLLFCSGVTSREPDGSVHAPGDPGEQTRYCFEKLRRVLAAAGCTYDDVVKVVTYVTKYEHRAAVSEVRRKYFTGPLPASTGLVVSSLADPELLFEIDVVAAVPSAEP